MSAQVGPSEWEAERFGDMALPLRGAIWRGLEAAHQRALAAHKGSGLDTNDAYGLMWLIQNPEVVKAVEKVVPGARRIKPLRARYELIVVGDIILYTWRFSDDAYSPLESAKMTLSKTREHLLALTPSIPDQLTFDHADLSEEELDAEFQDLQAFLDDAVEAGRMVVVAYASNPHAGVLRVYWGDASKADDQGRLNWSHFEEIPSPVDLGETGDTGFNGTTLRPAVPSAAGTNDEQTVRFDLRAEIDEIPLTPRNPLTAPDGGQPLAPRSDTGSDDD